MKSYYRHYPRDMANEYTIAMATDKELGKMLYGQPRKWQRIPRGLAKRMAKCKGADATEMFICYEIDGNEVDKQAWLDKLEPPKPIVN